MKITTKIRTDVINKLTKKFDAACLRRDAFLERVLEIEIPALDKEVAIPNSDEARKVVSKSLAELIKEDRMKPVSFSLRDDLVKQLDEICKRKNIVRDAFFNRVLFLLASRPEDIDHLFFFHREDDWRTEVWSELRNDGPFFNNVFYPLEPEIDPFWPIRAGLELEISNSKLIDYEVPKTGEIIQVKMDANGRPHLPESLYTVTFTENELMGLNTYIPEWKIPGPQEQDKPQKELDELLNELFGLGGNEK